MKKFVACILAAVLACLSAGCAVQTNSQNFKLTASFYPVMLAAKMVCGSVEGVEITTLAPPSTGCLHDYALMPQDLKNLEKSDMFVINGLGMEAFISKTAQSLPDLTTVDLSKGVPPVNGNAHIWLSPANMQKMLDNLCAALCAALPKHSEEFKANTEKYSVKLMQLDEKVRQSDFGGAPVITCHEAFDYFASECNLTIAGAIQREPGEEPSTKELVETTDLVRQTGAMILLTEPQYSASAAETVSRETGAKMYQLDPVVTGNAGDQPEVYFEKMEQNLQTLKKAIRKE